MSQKQKEEMSEEEMLATFETAFPTPPELKMIHDISQLIWKSSRVDKSKCPDEATLELIIMKSQALRIDPLLGLAKLYISKNGTIACSSELADALCMRINPLWKSKLAIADDEGTMIAIRGSEKTFVKYTKTELEGHPPMSPDWRSHPSDFIRARLIMRGARMLYADAITGLIATEEMNFDDEMRAEVAANQIERKKGLEFRNLSRQEEKLETKPEPTFEELAEEHEITFNDIHSADDLLAHLPKKKKTTKKEIFDGESKT